MRATPARNSLPSWAAHSCAPIWSRRRKYVMTMPAISPNGSKSYRRPVGKAAAKADAREAKTA